MSESPLKVWLDRDGKLLRLRLNQPKANIVDAAMIAALSSALGEYRESKGYYFSALLVSDVVTQDSLLLVAGEAEFLDTIDLYIEYLEFDTSIDSNTAGVGIKLSF